MPLAGRDDTCREEREQERGWYGNEKTAQHLIGDSRWWRCDPEPSLPPHTGRA